MSIFKKYHISNLSSRRTVGDDDSKKKVEGEASARTLDPHIAQDILSYVLSLFPDSTYPAILEEEKTALQNVEEPDLLALFLQCFFRIEEAYISAVPTSTAHELRKSAARAFGTFEGAEKFLLAIQNETFQLILLQEQIANHIARQLLEQSTIKKVQAIVDTSTQETLLRGVLVKEGRLYFGDAESTYLKLPPAWLRLVSDAMTVLIHSFFIALKDRVGESAAKLMVEEKVRSMGDSIESSPSFHKLVRTLPTEIITSKYLERMSKTELEVQVKKRTEELSSNTARLEKLLSENAALVAFPANNPNPILGISKTGKIIYSNPASEMLCKDLKLPTIEAILPPSHYSYLSECLASMKHLRAEVVLQNHTYEWLYVPLQSQDVVHLYATEITAKKQIESLLAEANVAAKILVQKDQALTEANHTLTDINNELSLVGKELVRRDQELTEANNRLVELDQMKSEFVSVAAHQLRTPLTGIRWTLHALAEREFGDLTPDQDKFIHTALKTVITAVALINDLLNVARMEDGRFGFVMKLDNVVDILKGSVARFAIPATEKGINLTFEKNGDPKKIPIDAEKMAMVFDNLIDNAIKYTEPGGAVIVALYADADRIRIVVSDTGIGVPQDQNHKLFSKFFRAQNAQLFHTSGTGLGLYIVKNVIEKHKGQIAFESVEKKGTTFTITLPIPHTA